MGNRVVASVEPAGRSPAQIAREFRERLAAGGRIRALGTARRRPGTLLSAGYVPRARIDLFDAVYYLTGVRQNEDIRFFVAYVVLGEGTRRAREIHPRIFYKDVSLVWRSASHFVSTSEETWIGKGDVQCVTIDGEDMVESDEATTDLPLEIQTALETLLRRTRRILHDEKALGRILRRGAPDRIEAFADFTGPRRRAAADPANLVNGGRRIARFTRKRDPASLVFVPGYEPDFRAGVLERSEGRSRLYGGRLRRFRVASRNARVQYLFIAGRRQVWIASLQPTTTELMSYGVRTVGVEAPDELLMPGYEYHFFDEEQERLFSQIPEGFVGPSSPHDLDRADASPWLDRMPVIREFRRRVLGQRPGRSRLS